jgi:hypothetical protein
MGLGCKQPVCIIGMHRSGTSMVTRLLRFCGLDLGPDDMLMGASNGNADGHFEHLGFVAINDALLEHFRGSWDHPPSLKAGWEQDPSLEHLERQALDLIALFSDSGCWGWKDPRTTLLLPFWQRLVPNLRYVICMRNPLAVARSLAERNRLSIAASAELWYQYSRKAIRDTSPGQRLLSFYDDYFADSLQELTRVAQFCGLDKGGDAMAAQVIVSPPLRHQSTGLTELIQEECIPLEYKLFYLGLRALRVESAFAQKREGTGADLPGSGAMELITVMDDFRAAQRAARLEAMIANMELLVKRSETVIEKRECEIARLKAENAQLRAFADSVRKTWAYRAYRKVIWPLRNL